MYVQMIQWKGRLGEEEEEERKGGDRVTVVPYRRLQPPDPRLCDAHS